MPAMDDAGARAAFAGARVARLATVRSDGRPHLVPVTFAVDGDTVFSAVDGKPKRHTDLLRLANIAHEPRVTLLADGYAEDWARLWWVRVDGVATVHDARSDRSGGSDGENTAARQDAAVVAAAHRRLREKYTQYADIELGPVVIAIQVRRWASWSAS